MNNYHEEERRLRTFQPSGPSERLRTRVIAGVEHESTSREARLSARWRQWWAAAALVTAIVVLRAVTASAYDDMFRQGAASPRAAYEAAIARVAAILGGDVGAVQEAQRQIAATEHDQRVDAALFEPEEQR